MFRYIALVWNDARDLRRDTPEVIARRIQSGSVDWRCAIDLPGLKLFCTGERGGSLEAHPLPCSAGAIVGTVFRPASNEPADVPEHKTFSMPEIRSLRSTNARSLVDLCWGRYVALVRDPARQVTHVVRDPSGALPCYRTRFLDVDVFFSAVEDITRIGLLRLNVDWNYIAARVVFMALSCRETALEDVTEVLAGERISIGQGGHQRSFVWNPLDVARTEPLENAKAAAYEMHRVACACIHAWGACHSSILHSLSGGLDSSIVLGCLARAPNRPRIHCFNYYSAGCDGDERAFAWQAARHNACSLVERQRSEQVDLADLLSIERSCVPTFYLAALQSNREIAQLANEVGASAIFGGGGGDQLFYQTEAVLGAADRLRMHGINLDYLRVALDTAHLGRVSIWKVIGESLRLALFPWRWSPRGDAVHQRKLVSARTIKDTVERAGYTHPLLEAARRAPPGKRWHAWSLSIPQEFYDPRGRADDAERIQPLISQPLVETCLRIPTYVMTERGWDRSIARQAFHQEVPEAICKRRSKGGMEEHVQAILMRNIETARDLLLNGHLVERGLLDRTAVAEVLSGGPTRIPGAMAEIFDHLSTEAWLRSWHPIPSSAEAIEGAHTPHSLTG